MKKLDKVLVIISFLLGTLLYGIDIFKADEIRTPLYSVEKNIDGIKINGYMISEDYWNNILKEHPRVDNYFKYNITNNPELSIYVERILKSYDIPTYFDSGSSQSGNRSSDRSQLITPEWVATVSGSRGGSEEIKGIDTDENGNIYVVGTFEGEFEIGATTLSATNESRDIFVAKFDASYNLTWVVQGEVEGNPNVTGLATNDYGVIVLTGNFYNGSVTFGNNSVSGANGNGMFVVKITSDGLTSWISEVTAEYGPYSNSIDIDNDGKIYLTGYFSRSTYFGDDYFYLDNNQNNIFISKINKSYYSSKCTHIKYKI